jgi:hypothetical protein
MRIREILSEDWWKDLDPGFLSMMGYTSDEPAVEDKSDLIGQIDQTVKKIRSTPR